MFRVRSPIFTLAAHELHRHLERFKAIQSNSKRFKVIQTKKSTPPPKAPVRAEVRRRRIRSQTESNGVIRSYSEFKKSRNRGTRFTFQRFTFYASRLHLVFKPF